MAATFKNVIKPQVGKPATAESDWTTIYTAPSGKTSYIIQCDISCVGTTGVQTSVRIKKADTTTIGHLVKMAPVPIGSAIQVIDGQKLVLEPGDSLQVVCETVSEKVDVIVSLIEDVNE